LDWQLVTGNWRLKSKGRHMADLTTTTLPVLPLRSGVVFPHMVVTVTIESDEAKRAIAAAENSGGLLVLIPQLDEKYASVGTIAEIQEVSTGIGTTALISGVSRARIGAGQPSTGEVLWVEAIPIEEPTEHEAATLELANEFRTVVREILDHRGIAGVADRILASDDPGQLADLSVHSPDLTAAQKIELLETVDVHERLERALDMMNEVLADVVIRQRVRDDATERIDKSQREFLIRQQIESLRKELGDESGSAVDDYRQQLTDADMPETVADAVEREIDRLERMNEQSPEVGWVRTWLDTVFELPWGIETTDNLDLEAARSVLDADHTGLDDVKERIVEHLAVRKLRRERGVDETADDRRGGGAILLLVGPPGVGKTSLGESVAQALGREFIRVSLGGIRDEAEVRGHRRTYVGARPGRIARALADAGSMNPVFLLDEMDKVGSDWRGDPSSALLEVLDPAQNHTFRDHYLEFDLDLSDVLFIATANVIESIPGPLLDRTEMIRLDGYTDEEKVDIARDHLLPRRLSSVGLEPDEVMVSDEALASIVEKYTREAGVRGLERMLGKLARKSAMKIASDDTDTVNVTEAELVDLLGKPTVFRDEAGDRTRVPGVATGLAVTGAGGDVLFVEASVMPGNQALTVTGQLGDVMKESAEIALSYVRSNAVHLGIDPDQLDQAIHLHVPAGAIPKDGPSAGITLTTALVSLLTGRKVKDTVGMTGELTLQGRVLPIGGVKQKVLAAHRAGLTEVIIPARNEDDLDELPESIIESMRFHPTDDISSVLELALE
jgi:ATP-dependent Lon protease